jgi:hypothetical protein
LLFCFSLILISVQVQRWCCCAAHAIEKKSVGASVSVRWRESLLTKKAFEFPRGVRARPSGGVIAARRGVHVRPLYNNGKAHNNNDDYRFISCEESCCGGRDLLPLISENAQDAPAPNRFFHSAADIISRSLPEKLIFAPLFLGDN